MESNVVVNRIEKGNVVSTTTIPNSKPKNSKEERLTTLKMLREKYQGQKETTLKTETSESNNEKTGLVVIPNDNAQVSTPPTSTSRQPSYQEHLASFDLVGSDSVKLIDESAKHLHERMLLTGSVVEAVMCANQIGKLLKLKLEIRIATRE